MTISIFTPTHNGRYLRQIYEKLKDQDFMEWVILFNGDARPIYEFTMDNRIRQIQSKCGSHYVGALKREACELCSGDILVELDHDDLLSPDALASIEDAFQDNQIVFAYSDTARGRQEGKEWFKTPRFTEGHGWEYEDSPGGTLDIYKAFDPHPFNISRIWYAPDHVRAFRRSSYIACGGYDPTMRILDDQDLMCRLYSHGGFHHIKKGIYLYRLHDQNAHVKYGAEIQHNVLRLHDQYITEMARNWAVRNNLAALDLGGRLNPAYGYTTVDLKDADIKANLEATWPFHDGSVGAVRAYDVFEHLKDPLYTMKELDRVLAPNGIALIQVPSTDGRGAFQDPTHVSFWNENSFLYYTHQNWSKYIDTPVKFQEIRKYTTEKDHMGVCWTVAHLMKLGPTRVGGPINFDLIED